MSGLVVGIFVGGASRRMGGVPKGLLPALECDGTTVVERTARLAQTVATEVVLVGTNEAYAHLGLRMLKDACSDAGPLAGVVSLLAHASAHGDDAIGLACDMPHLTISLLARLARADSSHPIVAPRDGDRWSALFARYRASRVLPTAEKYLAHANRSLQALFDAAGTFALALSDEERLTLSDWDAPADVERSRTNLRGEG